MDSLKAMEESLKGNFMQPAPPEPNCPFYGCALVRYASPSGNHPPFLISTHGNQCAMVTTSHAPCYLEIEGHRPEWKQCKIIKSHRIGEK